MTIEKKMEFAGFWRRFIAFTIDGSIVSLIVFPFALIIGLTYPKTILVEMPFDLFTSTEMIRELPETIKVNDDGSTSIIQSHIEKKVVLGLLENYYKVSTTKVTSKPKKTGKSSEKLINPTTEHEITKTTSHKIESIVIFIYWILLESSRLQGSIGKKIMGIKVVTAEGGKLTIYQAAGRNLLKILSSAILLIGYMMAGWTSKKQALHDKIINVVVIKE